MIEIMMIIYRKRFVEVQIMKPAKARKGSTGLWSTPLRDAEGGGVVHRPVVEVEAMGRRKPGLVISVYSAAVNFGVIEGGSHIFYKYLISLN